MKFGKLAEASFGKDNRAKLKADIEYVLRIYTYFNIRATVGASLSSCLFVIVSSYSFVVFRCMYLMFCRFLDKKPPIDFEVSGRCCNFAVYRNQISI